MKPEEVIVGTGVSGIMDQWVWMLCNEGDGILIGEPLSSGSAKGGHYLNIQQFETNPDHLFLPLTSPGTLCEDTVSLRIPCQHQKRLGEGYEFLATNWESFIPRARMLIFSFG